jgi:hypothetical protein
MGQEGDMFIDQARPHTIDWRKLAVALAVATCVALVTVLVRFIV